MKRINNTFVFLLFFIILPLLAPAQTTKIKKVALQGFWWDYKNDNYPNSWSNYLTELAPRLKSMGFDAIWIPPAYKNQAPTWVGYGPMDHYDLGDKYQKGSPNVQTAMGTKDELLRMIAVMHANGIEVIQDVVLNHVDGAGSANGSGGQDTDPTYSMVTNSGFKNFRYTCYATPAIDESQNDYWTRRGRWPKNYTNFHPNGNNNCATGDICSPFFGPDFDYSLNSSGPSSNIPTSGTPAGYPATRPYYNPPQGTDYMYNGATEWLKWYHKQTNVDGYRWDAVKHFPVYVQRDITRQVKYNVGSFNGTYSMFNIGEWIGNKSDIDNYVTNMAQPSLSFGYEEHTGTFDFSLRAYSNVAGASLYDMVVNNFSGGYNLANLPGIQQDKRFTDYASPSARVHRTIPFVNSHDTYRPFLTANGNFSQPLGVSSGWNTSQELGGNGQHIDPREPRVAAAYAVACAVDGNPMVFFEDVFNIGTTGKRWTHRPDNTTDLPAWNDVANIVQCHQKLQFKEGNYKVRSAEAGAFFPAGSSANNHLVFERSARAVIGVNDQFSIDQELWIDSDFPAGTILMDYSGANGTTTSVVQGDKRVFIRTKAVGHTVPNVFGHGYSVWAPVPGNVPFASVSAMLAYLNYTPARAVETTQEWEMDDDLGDSHCGSLGYGGRTPDNSPNDRIVGKIFAAANTNVAYTVTLGTPGNSLTLDICRLDGTVMGTISGSTATISGAFTNDATRWLTIKVRNTAANTPGQKCFVKMTYTAPASVVVDNFPAATTVSIWTSNGGSSDWNDPKNWEECKIPTCAGTVLIPHEVKFMPSFDPCFTGTLINNATLSLRPKVVLHGPYNTATGLMNDDLRSGNYIPLTTPYGGSETTTSGVLAVTGPNAIVDWVKLELRDKNTPTTVVRTFSALLQRDGDVVGTDGVSPVFVGGLAFDNYYIAVRHRNHLGTMTASPIVLGNGLNTTDFTSAVTYGLNGQRQLASGAYALWSGNGNNDNKIKYQGDSNDSNVTLSHVLSSPGNNPGFSFNYDLAFGYLLGDYNMDGKAKYQGDSNDINVVLSSVLSYPGNLGFAYNYDLLIEQIP
jgi:glycosidase